eukprot:jgi/Mesvir1/29584/Mv03099-RA.1
MFLRNALVRRLDDKFPVVIGVNASTLTDAAVTSPVYNGVMTGRELYERVSMVDYDNTTATTFKLLAAAENNSNPTVSNLVTDIKCLILAGSANRTSNNLFFKLGGNDLDLLAQYAAKGTADTSVNTKLAGGVEVLPGAFGLLSRFGTVTSQFPPPRIIVR